MKIKLQNADKHLNEKLKSAKFREAYEFERVKVALAQKIAEVREDHNLKQAELASKMHVSQQFISQVESGDTNLTMESLFKLARSLRTSITISISKKPSRNPSLKVA